MFKLQYGAEWIIIILIIPSLRPGTSCRVEGLAPLRDQFFRVVIGNFVGIVIMGGSRFNRQNLTEF